MFNGERDWDLDQHCGFNASGSTTNSADLSPPNDVLVSVGFFVPGLFHHLFLFTNFEPTFQGQDLHLRSSVRFTTRSNLLVWILLQYCGSHG